MNVIEFGYKKFRPDLSEKQPFIQVTIYLKGKPFDTFGIVDSGADFVTIPISAALGLGIEPSEFGRRCETGCACGNKEFFSYLFDGEIEIGKHRFPIKISLVDSNTEVLIGRQGVFEYFHVEFNKDTKKGYFKR